MNRKSAITSGIVAGLLLAGLVASASTAAAEIVYTPVNATISGTGNIKLDLNHDGIPDFVLRSVSTLTICGNRGELRGVTRLTPKSGGGVVVSDLDFAAVMPAGIPVGKNSMFYDKKTIVTQFFICSAGTKDVSGYLGVEFPLNGKLHYGWLQISIHARFFQTAGDMETTLLDFAYETVAGKEIETGQTSKP